MVFSSFGVVVRPGTPYTLPATPGTTGSLHINQISIDDGSSSRTVTVCRTLAADKIPIIIARLLPGVVESMFTDLPYNLSEEVTFFVLGPRNVHLHGYFDLQRPSSDTESFGEDIAQTESEKSSDDDAYEGSFINDGDLGLLSSSATTKDCSIDEKTNSNQKKRNHLRAEIQSSANSSGQSGRNRSQTGSQVSDSGDDFEFHENSLLKRKLLQNGLVEGAGQKIQDLTWNSEQINDKSEKDGSVFPDTEDEDCLQVSSPRNQSVGGNLFKEGSNNVNPESLCENGTLEGELRLNTRGNIHKAGKPGLAMQRSPQTAKETELEPKTKIKKKVKRGLHGTNESIEERVFEVLNANMKNEEKEIASVKHLEAGKADHALLQSNESVKDGPMILEMKRKERDVKGQDPAIAENDAKTTSVTRVLVVALPGKTEDESRKEASDESKKKRKKSEPRSNAVGVDDVNGSTSVDAEPRVWTSPNGVVVEEIVHGDPSGKIASPGKKLYVHYVGKLEGTDDAFASTIGSTPLKFRLGDDEAITGWNEGLEGIRVGGGRRLIIPQSMGNGPPGSRLIYEIEVVRIRG